MITLSDPLLDFARYMPVKTTENANKFRGVNFSEKMIQASIAVITGSSNKHTATNPEENLLRLSA